MSSRNGTPTARRVQRMRWFKEGLVSGELERCRLLFDLQQSEL